MKRFTHLIPVAIALIFASQTAEAKPRAISIDSGLTETIVGVPSSTVMTMFISASPDADADYIALGGPTITNGVPTPGAPIFCTQAISGTCAGATAPGTTANLGTTTATGELPAGIGISGSVQFVLVDTTSQQTFGSGFSVTSLDPNYGVGFVFQDWVTSDYSDYGFGALPASASALAGLPAGAHLQFIGWDNTISCPDPSPDVVCNGAPGDGVDSYQYNDVVMAVWFVPQTTDAPEPLTLALFAAGLIGVLAIGRRYSAPLAA